MPSLKNKIINQIIEVEGGYVNDRSDSGGETKYGITVNVAQANGYLGSMKDLPRDLAVEIYSGKYWDRMGLDEIQKVSEEIAEEIVDTAVNMGTVRAGKFFQTALNALNNCGTYYPDLVVDGNIGARSLAALRAYTHKRGQAGIGVLHSMLNCLQGAYYIELTALRKKDEKFIYGWFKNRIS